MATQFSIHDGRKWKASFFTIWTGQALSIFGSQLVLFALVWYLTIETGSATILATATMVSMLPRLLLSPVIGSIVDRGSRRLIMILADGGIALATLLLAVLFATGNIQIWHIYVIAILRSIGQAFHSPAMTASTSLMVPKEHLTRIQGLNQMLNGGLSIISAPLGAFFLEVINVQGVLMIDVVTAIVAITPLLFIAIPQPERSNKQPNGEKTSLWQDIKEGFGYFKTNHGILIICLMATAINFILSPAFSLIPLHIKDYFGGSAQDYGLFEGLFGVGMLSGGLLLSVWGGFKRKIVTSLVNFLFMGSGVVLMGALPPSAFSIVLALSVFLGITNVLVNGPLGAILQTSVPPDMQGRVMAVVNSLTSIMTPVGLLFAGPLSDAFGVRYWYIAGGILTVILGIAGLLIPKVLYVEGKELDPLVIAETAPVQSTD